MSTRSRIGVIREAKADPPVVESIYCHFDGYPEGVGQTLLDHWTDPAKIDRLIALGDLSSLGKRIGRKHDFDQHLPRYYDEEHREATKDMSDEEATAYRIQLDKDSPHGKGWCNAYRRDRGEQNCESKTHPITDWPDYGQEAEYVFDGQEWRVSTDARGNPVGWNTVAPSGGWVTIPEAIALEVAAREEYEKANA